MSRAFWGDDFDMDLLKIFPNLPQMISAPDRELWTVGSHKDGSLLHPTVWNSHGAYLWTENPTILRDEHGWFNVHGCVADSEVVQCTWLEWLRDAWVHSYGWLMLPSLVPVPAAPRDAFNVIMYDLRKWTPRDTTLAKVEAMSWVVECDFRLQDAIQRGAVAQ